MPFRKFYKSNKTSKYYKPNNLNKNYKSKKTATKSYIRKPMSNTNFVAKRLGDGVQYHKTSYGEQITMSVGGTATWFYDAIGRSIPKYRNDPTASGREANMQICRIRDKLYFKGAKVRLGVANLDVNQPVMLRWIFIRNSAWDEEVSTAGFGANWFKSTVDGSNEGPNVSMPTALTQSFNTDHLRDKRKDLFFDKKIILAPLGGATGRSCAYYNFYLPIDQMGIFESKGDTASADDLAGGRYYMLFTVSSNDAGVTSDIKIDWKLDLIWAEN